MFSKLWQGIKNAGWAFKRTVRTYSLSGEGFWRQFSANYSRATYETMAREVVRNATARRGISEIINRVQQVWSLIKPVRENDDGSLEEVDHPIMDLLQRPNPRFPGSYLVSGMVWQWYLAGEWFLHAFIPETGPDRRKVPQQLHLFRGSEFVGFDRDPATGFPEGYHLQLPNDQQETFTRDEVLHARNYNPQANHRDRGLPLILAAMRKIDQQKSADKWNMSVASSGGRAPFYLMPRGLEPGDFLDEDMRDRTQEKIDEQYEKQAEESKPWVLSGMFEVVDASFTPEEASIREGYKMDSEEIAKALGLSPVLLGSVEGATYANLETSEYQAIRGVVMPLVDRFLDELNRWLMPKFGTGTDVFLTYDKRQIDALDVSMKHKVEALAKLVSNGIIERDEARAEIGYPEKGGDAARLFVPGNMLALGTDDDPSGGTEGNPATSEDIEQIISDMDDMTQEEFERFIDGTFRSMVSGRAPRANGTGGTTEDMKRHKPTTNGSVVT
jgi:HK97 family phage portal protein